MSFADFPEQQQVAALLRRSLQKGRLGHAYLFTGNDLSELEAVARTLAKTLNCQAPPEKSAAGLPLDSCDQCSSCRRIDGGTHSDVIWVRPESKSRIITIDQMRAVMSTIQLKPLEGVFKVAGIIAADRMKTEGGNAFLKTLEEPPANSVFILMTTEPQRILETILSRCLRLAFAGESGRRQMVELDWLRSFSETAAQESGDVLGRYRVLSSLLSKLAEQKEQIETALTARSPLNKYDEIDPKLRDRWEDELSASIESEYRRRRLELLAGLQWWLRDVWFQTLDLEEEMLSYPELLPATRTIATRLSPGLALENLQTLDQAQRLLYTNVQEALALEVALLKLKL
jgi:DNA polymerase III subunit delta'